MEFDRSLSPNPEDLETGIVFNLYVREQFHHRELFQTPFPTMLNLIFKGAFTPNPNPLIKWSHFARCDRSLSPNTEDLETGIVFILYRGVQFHHRELVQTPFPTILTLIFKTDFTPNPNPSIQWSHFARCDRSLISNPKYLETSIVFNLLGRKQLHHRELVQTPFPTMLTLNFKSNFTHNPNPSFKWSHFARCDRSLSPYPEDLETGIVFNLYGREQFHHRELFQTPFPTMLTLIFKGAFSPNPNPSIKWSHFARCDRSLSPNPKYLETSIVFNLLGREQLHHRELVQTPFPTMLTLNFKSDFTPNPNPSIKWSHFARCYRSLSPNTEDLKTGIVFILYRGVQFHHRELVHTTFPTILTLIFKIDFTPNPNLSFKWSHFARCDRSLSPNPEYLETGIVFNLYGREQFHHRELVQTPFPTMLTLNFKDALTPNPNTSIKWSHFARCDRSLSPNPEDLETGIAFILYRRVQFHHRELVQTTFPTILTLIFKIDFTPNPNPSIKWSHFARCDRSLSPNPKYLETSIVFNLLGRKQLHHRELVQTPFPTMLTLNFKSNFTSNPNPSIKWIHFARCDRSISPYPEDLETGIVFNLFGREQFHHRELVQTPFPTMLTLNFKSNFTHNPNPSFKWSHFARCDRSLSPYPEDLETGIVFNLYGREQFHHRELFQTPFPTMLTLIFKGAFTPNPNPSIKWSHFARCDRSLSPNPEDLETGIVFILYRRVQFHHRELVQTTFPTILTLKIDFTPHPNPSFKWSHFSRCDRSLSPYPEDLETGIVFNLFGRKQFQHRKLVQTPFPTMLTLNFKSDFTSNPNPSIKWSHFARCDRSLSPYPKYLETSIVFNLLGREQLHHRELVQTPFPTMLTLIFKGAFTPNPNPSIKWSQFARCDRSLSPNPKYLETSIVFNLLGREQLHHRELVQTPFPTMLTLNFKSNFTSNPNPSIKWIHFARCDRSISPYPEDLETGIVFNLFGREQFHHRELVQTPFPTMLTLNFKSNFTHNPNPSFKWSHFARCDRSLSPYPEDLETSIVFNLYGREQFHHRELFQTPFPTMLTLIFKGAFSPNPNPSIKWSHFARCDRSLSPNPEDLETGIVFILYRRVQFHHRELVQTTFPTILTFIFKIDFTHNPNPSFKWSHLSRCDRSLSPYPEDLETGIVFNLFGREQFQHRKLVQTPFPTMLTLNFKSDFTSNPNPSIKWSHFARCDRSLSPYPKYLETSIVFNLLGREQLHHRELVQTPFPTMLTLNFKGAFTPNPNPSIKWSQFARCDRSLSPNPKYLETSIVFNLLGREQLHHRELVQTPFPTMLTLNFKSNFTSNPNPSIKWIHFARCDRSISPYPEDLETGIVFNLFGREQFHHRELVQTPFPTMLTLNFKSNFTHNPNPSFKWSHFARCDRSLSPYPEDLETSIVFNLYGREQFHHRELFQTPFPTMLTLIFKGAFSPNPNPSIKWSHFARCDRSLSPNPEDLETGIVFILYRRVQFHHRELVQTTFPTILTFIFKIDFTPNPNPSFKWSHLSRCDRSLSPYPEDLETGIVFNLFGREQFQHRKLVQTPFPTMLTLNFKSDFTSNPNPSIKWSHFARCDRSLSPNPKYLETSIVFNLLGREQFHHRELVQTPFPTMLTLNFKSNFTHNPNPSFKWSHFARCDRSLSPYPEDLETSIVFNLYGREQFHHRELFQTPFPTMLTLIFKGAFSPNPNPSIKWSHFARCDRSLSPNPEDLETGIVFILYRRVQFHHRELVQTTFPTILTFIFKIDFTPNPNPSFKWSHLSRCDRSLSPYPEDLETGIVFNLFGREQFQHRKLVQTPFPTMLTLNFKSDFTSNPNPSIKWSHFARCDRSLSPYPKYLETSIVFNLLGREQLHHRELVQTPFPTMLTLIFKGAFTPNPNPSIKWSQFARCDRSLSPNTKYLETSIVFNLLGREQLHHRELVQTPFPTMLTLNFKSNFTSNPNPSIKWIHFARCDRSISPYPEDLETGIVFNLFGREQFHHRELVQTPFPTMLTLNFKSNFTHNPNPSFKWSHFARCDRSLSPYPEDLETSIVFNLYGREQFHHRELFQTPFPTMLTLIFKGAFSPNPNPSIKWSHFARCDRSLSPNPEDLETGIVFILYRRVQFHHRELVQTTFPTILTFIFKIDFTPNPNPSFKWSHLSRCDRSLSPYPEDLETGIVFNLFGREQFQHRKLVQTPFPTMLTLNFKSDFTSNPNPSIKWSHFARCDRSLSPNPKYLETSIVFNLLGRE
ncbi:unnamed protein product [Clavelina lepadiformis]|uniref:Uncharacterized protein n=1 Tax=Clavelina lepadiformis TaxID=159417 RepID=A0ABP0GP62_CLALP